MTHQYSSDIGWTVSKALRWGDNELRLSVSDTAQNALDMDMFTRVDVGHLVHEGTFTIPFAKLPEFMRACREARIHAIDSGRTGPCP